MSGGPAQEHTAGVWQERADRVQRDVAALAATGMGVADLYAAAMRRIGEVVSADLTCWFAIDPETLVVSSVVSGEPGIPREYEPRLAEAEYTVAEPHRFAALASSGQRVATLSDMTRRDRDRSSRFNAVWRPLGLDQELRVLFLADGVCWGAAGMARAGPDFSARDREFLAAVSPAVAHATRAAVRTEALRSEPGRSPAIVVVSSEGEPAAVTPGAREWQERLEEIAPGRFRVMMQVVAAGARSTESAVFRAKVRDARGAWAVLEASPLLGGESPQVAVHIAPATGDHVLGLMLAAYGLSPRERDICAQVLGGYSTAEIADHLFISVHTVQDHLKSVFAKTGVRSRGELAARLRPVAAAPPAVVTPQRLPGGPVPVADRVAVAPRAAG
jgi:DNA-binding CsgD family transcriptional regulator